MVKSVLRIRGAGVINFIICEDNAYFLEKIKEIVDQVMFGTKMEYQKHCFTNYNSDVENIINESLINKIYILDMQMRPIRGIDIAREIRQQDMESLIIFVTAYQKTFRDEVLDSILMYFAFIQKNENFSSVLYERLNQAIKINFNKLSITFEDHNRLYKIPFQNVLYITTNTFKRKSLIITDNEFFEINKTLTEIIDIFKNKLIMVHRSYLVNPNRVKFVNKKEKRITFDNNKTYQILSKKYKDSLDYLFFNQDYKPNDSTLKIHN